jgi:hypothetical protein
MPGAPRATSNARRHAASNQRPTRTRAKGTKKSDEIHPQAALAPPHNGRRLPRAVRRARRQRLCGRHDHRQEHQGRDRHRQGRQKPLARYQEAERESRQLAERPARPGRVPGAEGRSGATGPQGRQGGSGAERCGSRQVPNQHDIACAADVVGTLPVSIPSPSRIWTHAHGSIQNDNSGATEAGLWLRLRDAANTKTLAVSVASWEGELAARTVSRSRPAA